MGESRTETAEKDRAAASRKGKKGKALVGDRYRVELVKGDDRISLGATPKAGGGYKVGARQTKDGKTRPATPKSFATFDAAKAHIEGLVKMGIEKGWTPKRKLSIEELF